jgi:(2S)-methylsuccinyl-CoA dehydrogenase
MSLTAEPIAKQKTAAQTDAVMPNLLSTCRAATDQIIAYREAARTALMLRVAPAGKTLADRLEAEQHAAHGFAWIATYAAALEQLIGWAERLHGEAKLGTLEALILQLGFAEYINQLRGGLPMSQGEMVRPNDLDLQAAAQQYLTAGAAGTLAADGNSMAARAGLAEALLDGADQQLFGELGLGDETLAMIQEQFSRFAADKVAPFAHEWHLADDLIPMSVIDEMASLGVFGLTVPEEFGGLGLGKLAMCVVTEELSRAYIGVGSLSTRSEIAAELIRLGGTEDQQAHWLPKIASGEILPTAVFTEPGTGSDLASLKTRAVRDGDVYRITGNKTWITHAARADVMTLLARTDTNTPGYKGLSMFLAEKPRGDDDAPFPAIGMTGGEIGVLGYRGMKEYELGFDGFEVKADNLLGGREGEGFKQLMATFESARIQTAARAVGVSQNALELALSYGRDRHQFGQPIVHFPRVANKLAMMAVETMMARQLTYFAAREKDLDRRCDIEAGMAKLLAARAAWASADNALQIHGGNGYAEEYAISRVLCDARILNIFEGAAEIQAQVIARGLLAPRN